MGEQALAMFGGGSDAYRGMRTGAWKVFSQVKKRRREGGGAGAGSGWNADG